MKNRLFSLASLLALAGPYFAANRDVPMLLSTTHDGVFYRPENRSYAEHEARKHEAEVVEISLEAHRAAEVNTLPVSLADLVAGAQRFVFAAPEQPAAPEPAGQQPAEVAAPAEAPKKKGRKAPTSTTA